MTSFTTFLPSLLKSSVTVKLFPFKVKFAGFLSSIMENNSGLSSYSSISLSPMKIRRLVLSVPTLVVLAKVVKMLSHSSWGNSCRRVKP